MSSLDRMTETPTLTDFLLARIAEDEAQAKRSKAHNAMNPNLRIPASWISGVADRVLAECEAKRRIVEFHKSWPVLVEGPPEFSTDSGGDVDSMTMRMGRQVAWTTEQAYRDHFGSEPPTGPILQALAAVYADHPDYRPEWAL